VSDPPDLRAQFGELLVTYAEAIRRLCSAYAPGRSDAEDLFQEIALALWRALPAFRGEASTRTWLYRVAHNVAFTWQVRDRRRQARETPLEAEFAVTGETGLRRLALRRALEVMSPADRALTILWLEGLSAREIEDVTGVRAATIAVRLSRIRRQLAPVEVR
jgi:RNA polymerase sigma-70 factor (ECF subfamily)